MKCVGLFSLCLLGITGCEERPEPPSSTQPADEGPIAYTPDPIEAKYLSCTDLAYEKGELIGFGWSARVYRGQLNSQSVAIKDYAPDRFMYTDKAKENGRPFEQQPWFLPHLATCFDQEENKFRVFQGLAAGKNLLQWTEQGKRWSAREKQLITQQIATVMDDMHAIGLKMEDVHPRQFVVDEESLHVVMVDFDGLRELNHCASWEYPDARRHDEPIFYMMFSPPEAHGQHENSCSEATDIYMLGQLMWYLTNGPNPIPVDGVFDCDEDEHTSAAFCRVMQQCLSANPSERPRLKDLVFN